MEILLAVIVAAVFGVLWKLSSRRQEKDWQLLSSTLEAMVDGKRPTDLALARDERFARLTPTLERLVDEQARLRAVVHEEEFNLQTILASMEEGVMVVDAQHVIRRVNPSFFQLFEVKTTPLGQTVLRTLREADFEELVTAVLQTGEPRAAEVTRTGGKRTRHFAVHSVPMRDSAGRPGVLMIFRDISRLKQLEEVRREFVANVSHELRTPLSIFHGYVENLLDNPDLPREDLRSVVEILHKHSMRLNALLEDLLILARLESRRDPLQVEPVDLRQFFVSIAMDWEVKLSRKNVRLEWQIAPGVPLLPADPLRLEQVLNNLVDNAVKYTPDGGQICVRAELSGESHLSISVEDDGAGIPPADLPHIFERFYRADKARSREHGGTGLGLSIVKHIVQSHGGNVRAESRYGKGTIIVLQFPLTAMPEAAVEEEQKAVA